MAIRIRALLVLLVWVASVEVCWGWGEDAVDHMNLAAGNMKDKAQEAKQGATEFMEDAKEKTDSWADWAYGKFSEGFGFKQDEAKETGQRMMMDKTGDAASKATDTVNEVSKYATHKAAEKMGDAKEYASNVAFDAKETTAQGKDKAYDAYGMASDKTKEMASEYKVGDAKDTAYDAYKGAKDKVGETYMSSKETMTDQAKEKYEAAKEKASQAAGDVGAKIKKGTAEL
uniref:Late embryogenesis abundant protein D-29 n=1 Tax=Davidia involucrata TaxID=16924 RepID=A0A5B7B2W2_DAVIN